MGAPIGNRNAANAKMWRGAIERALDKRGGGDRAVALDALAEKLLALCDSADLQALREVGDRLDGKAIQTNDVNVKGSLTAVLSGLGRASGSAADNP